MEKANVKKMSIWKNKLKESWFLVDKLDLAERKCELFGEEIFRLSCCFKISFFFFTSKTICKYKQNGGSTGLGVQACKKYQQIHDIVVATYELYFVGSIKLLFSAVHVPQKSNAI